MKNVNIKDLEIVSIENFENEYQLEDIESGVYRVSFDMICRVDVDRDGMFSVEDSEDFDEWDEFCSSEIFGDRFVVCFSEEDSIEYIRVGV